jgi:hypothetical protein
MTLTTSTDDEIETLRRIFGSPGDTAMSDTIELDSFTRAYIVAALWSSTDDEGEPLDARYDESDLAPEALAAMIADCERFQRENAGEIHSAWCAAGGDDEIFARSGHDFWLTRCGHGAGFWDGDWPEPQATALDNAATAFGNVDLYVGDDGKLYV